MKRVVWANKSNGQLCVTISKNSGVVEGDIVSIEKIKVNTIVYTPVTGDLFHYGQLRAIEQANQLGDLHICGVLTNAAIESYKGMPAAGLKEREAIVSALRCVDMTMTQQELDPTENLKEIHKKFSHSKIIVVYGSNWKTIPGEAYIKKIGGEIVQPEFYEKLSNERIVKTVLKNQKT